ncbi:MAG: pirin family protein [Nanoarchaeota archaeon]|nr:pirin family protein [Nanoarchaeota archaeon]
MTLIFIRRSEHRGETKTGWLLSKHSFSFGDYVDKKHRNFGDLQVLNEDFIKPDTGFGMHPHDNMEIITIVLSGTLKHVDSLAHTQTLLPGDVQQITAGTNIQHGEYNASSTQQVHLLQIWIRPRKKGLKPRYSQRRLPPLLNQETLLAWEKKDGKTLQIEQHARISRALFDKEIRHTAQKQSYVFLIKGKIKIENEILLTGDAAGMHGTFTLQPQEKSDVIIIDVE